MARSITQVFGGSEARSLVPKRSQKSNKASAGRLLIIAGSEAYFGAAILSATAAARSGAGYVQLLTEKKNFPHGKYPDFLITDFSKGIGDLSFDAVAIGPGLGPKRAVLRFIQQLMRRKAEKVVVDADALNLCAKEKLFPLPESWVLTPHEGELARMLGVSSNLIRGKRLLYAKHAQKKWKSTILLKGHRSLIVSSSQVIENKSGNAALAKAGTGDVLTGMIGAFMAQGLDPVDAAALGTYVHGFMADQWLRKKDVLSLMASDLLEMLPSALKEIREKK